MIKEIIKSDMDVFFSDFAETVTYERNSIQYKVKAVIGGQKIDEEEIIDVEAKTEIYVKQKEIEDLGLGEPQPHDLIDGKWEVATRVLNEGVWKLSCYASVRPKP